MTDALLLMCLQKLSKSIVEGLTFTAPDSCLIENIYHIQIFRGCRQLNQRNLYQGQADLRREGLMPFSDSV